MISRKATNFLLGAEMQLSDGRWLRKEQVSRIIVSLHNASWNGISNIAAAITYPTKEGKKILDLNKF